MDTQTESVPPKAIIADLWKNTLELENVTDDTDFFKVGGHSLKAMVFVSEFEQRSGIAIPLSALVQNSTLVDLAQYVSENPENSRETVEPFSIDGKETQVEYLLRYNDDDKQSKRTESYEKYYAEALSSTAHKKFCEQVYGKNYGQHGMADFKQLDAMLAKLDAKPGDTILDVGCGYGLISRYISDKTGANVVGIDLAGSAIKTATKNAEDAKDRLSFKQMDLQDLKFDNGTFDHVVSIDTIYFTKNQRHTIDQFRDILKPGGRVAVFRTFPIRSFTSETWSPDITELATILRDRFGSYEAIDFSTEENEHWASKVQVLESLEKEFVSEGSLELYQFRYGEAKYEATIEQFRYLFLAQK